MSIYDKASLVQIPSGYKGGLSNGTLYNVVPNTADGDFRHTRPSSATRVNKDGLIETVASNVPRLDYPLLDGVVQDCPALLLEPQRQNLAERSEEFDNSYWTKARSSITANQTTSPDGSNTADKLIDSTDNNTHIVYRSFNVSTSNAYTFSCFIKKGSLSRAFLAFDAAIGQTVVFDLENGTVESEGTGVTSSSIIEYANDWYKCSLTHTPTTTTRLYRIGTYNGNISYTGTGTDFVYLWGVQLEAGSYPTSYIPTSGQAVTRSADVCNGAQADFNDSEGVLFAEISAIADDGTNRYISLSDGSTNNNIVIRIGSSNNVLSRLFRGGSPVGSAIIDDNTDTKTNMKVAIVYNNTSHSLYVNGFNIGTESVNSSYTSGTLDGLNFDAGNGTSDFYGNTKQLMTFNEALSDTELENLTSWDSFREMATEQLYSIE